MSWVWIALGLRLRILLETRLGFLKHYTYFNTPLIDIRQLFESISNYRITGTSYFIDENAINQPLALVRLYHLLSSLGGSSPLLGIKAFLFLCDFLTIAVQTSVISLIYPKEKD